MRFFSKAPTKVNKKKIFEAMENIFFHFNFCFFRQKFISIEYSRRYDNFFRSKLFHTMKKLEIFEIYFSLQPVS